MSMETLMNIETLMEVALANQMAIMATLLEDKHSNVVCEMLASQLELTKTFLGD